MTKDIIEKAYKVGDEKQASDGKTYYVSALNAAGKPLWRLKKDGGKITPTSSVGSSSKKTDDYTKKKTSSGGTTTTQKKDLKDYDPSELVNYAKKAKTSTLESIVNDKNQDKDIRQIAFNVLKTRDDYDRTKVDSSDLKNGHAAKPVATIQYKTKKPEVEIELPDTWIVRTPGKNGVLENKTASASGLRKLYASKSDDDLLKILNNPNGRWQNRQIAYDEAAARGIDEDKIDVSGKLQKEWDSQKRKHDLSESMKSGFNEDEEDTIDVDFKGLDHEEFMKEFPDGDTGWLDVNDPRVQKKFNGFKTIKDRQQYDALKTYYEPTTPGYLNPDNKIGQLNEQYDNFIKYDTTPMFISAGGAGAGKTFGWQIVAEENNLKQLESDDKVDDGDWGYVMCSDPEDDKDFRSMLAKYNGTYIDDDGEEHPHILVFDDADKILTSKAGAMKALMKKITDNNPKNRIFVNPETGENEVFRGALLIMTNKDAASISSSSEDAKAILSRGMLNDMKFTRAENMELINKRYKDMKLGSYQKQFVKQFPDKKKQEEIRQMVRDWLEENMNDADPAKFTPRTFIQVMSLVGPIIAKGNNTGIKFLNGTVQVGTSVPWQQQALKFIKSKENDIEKADTDIFTESEMVEAKKKLLENKKELKSKNKKKYNALYGKKAIDIFLFGEDAGDDSEEEEKTEKAFESDFGMSLDEAENLLLG